MSELPALKYLCVRRPRVMAQLPLAISFASRWFKATTSFRDRFDQLKPREKINDGLSFKISRVVEGTFFTPISIPTLHFSSFERWIFECLHDNSPNTSIRN